MSSLSPSFKFKIFVLVIICFLLTFTDGEFSLKKRVKRKVVFTKSSKFFFRVNGKENMLNYTNILAHGWGFRINYDLPSTLTQRKQFFKRDVHQDIQNVQNPLISGLVNCILKRLCGILSQPYIVRNCGIFCGVVKIIMNSQGLEADFFKTFARKCQLYEERCPRIFEKSMVFGVS
ncbi:hypothetical protein ABEB36_005509 [Hypothenemus hampei]|uniref:Saposin B-type domain-containing protein n=1 Tax=Hypothenemus hampei TaxID=57062 RepID=A0ABD1EYF8_HYPHA